MYVKFITPFNKKMFQEFYFMRPIKNCNLYFTYFTKILLRIFITNLEFLLRKLDLIPINNVYIYFITHKNTLIPIYLYWFRIKNQNLERIKIFILRNTYSRKQYIRKRPI